MFKAEMVIDEKDFQQYLRGYEQFLAAADSKIAPSGSVDELWHAHMNHTAHYRETCQRMWKRLIHHVPSLSDEE